jgi:cytochrome P450 monooxygenase OleP
LSVSDIDADPRELLSFPFPDTFSPNPSGALAELAKQAPAIRVRFGPGELPVWLIVRYEPARAMLADARFSRARTLEFGARLTGPQVPDPNSLLWLDPPEHTRVRRLVSGAFGNRRIEQLRPWIARTARDQVTAMVDEGPPADLCGKFAAQLPIDVICHLLGVPDVDRPRVREWSQGLFRFLTHREAAAKARESLFGYMDAIVGETESRLAGGAEPASLLDSLVVARDEGDRLSHVELRSLALTILVGGFETTAGVIANAVTTLLTDRSRWEMLVADPGCTSTAVEELLRFHPLTMTFPRVAAEDVEFEGFTVRAGEVVIAPFAALNRDERLYADPQRLDLTREPVANLTFGHGIHYCLGGRLAQIELAEALTALVELVPTLRLGVPADDLRYDLRAPIGRPVSLPVEWES